MSRGSTDSQLDTTSGCFVHARPEGHEPGSRLRPSQWTFLTLCTVRSTAVFITFAPQNHRQKPKGDDRKLRGAKRRERVHDQGQCALTLERAQIEIANRKEG